MTDTHSSEAASFSDGNSQSGHPSDHGHCHDEHHDHHDHHHQAAALEASSGPPQLGQPAAGAAAAPPQGTSEPGGASSKKPVSIGHQLKDTTRITSLVGQKNSFNYFEQHRTFHLSFHPNGQLLATASEDSTLAIWDVTTGSMRQRIPQESEVLRVAWSGPLGSTDRALLASANSTGKVRVWDAAQDASSQSPPLQPVCELPHGDESQVYAVRFMSESTLLTASDDVVYFWDLNTKSKVSQFSFTRLSEGAAFGGAARNPKDICYVFDVESGSLGGRPVLCVALSDGSVRIQDVRTATAAATLRRTGAAHLTALRLAAEAGVLVSCGGNGECTVWDVRNWTIRATLQGHARPVYGADLLPPSLAPSTTPTLMTWSSDTSLRMWDLNQAQGNVSCQETIYHHDFPILTCAFSPLGDRLALGGGTGDPRSHGSCCSATPDANLLLQQLW